MPISLYRRRIAATVIQLAKDDPSLVKEVIARLRESGEIEADDLVYLDRIADRWMKIAEDNGRHAAGSGMPLAFAIAAAIFSSRSGRSSFSVSAHRANAWSMSSCVRAPSKSRPSFRKSSISSGVNRSALPARSMVWTPLDL
jgi:hypothetical protein